GLGDVEPRVVVDDVLKVAASRSDVEHSRAFEMEIAYEPFHGPGDVEHDPGVRGILRELGVFDDARRVGELVEGCHFVLTPYRVVGRIGKLPRDQRTPEDERNRGDADTLAVSEIATHGLVPYLTGRVVPRSWILWWPASPGGKRMCQLRAGFDRR